MNSLPKKLLLMLTACLPLAAAAQRPAAKVPEWKGTVDLVLGTEDDEHTTFSFVSGLALLADGRLVVADWDERRVHVYTATGRHLFDIGGEGGGPGEFRKPCCMRVLGDGTLLIGDPQANRYNRYRVDADRARSIGTLTMRGGVMINPQGAAPARMSANRFARLMSVMGDCRSEFSLQQMDSLGAPARAFTFVAPPGDSLALYVNRTEESPDRRSCIFYPMPYGAQYLLEFSPAGDFARAISSRYDIEWRSADGALKTRVTRAEEAAAPFTSEEREEIAGQLAYVRGEYKGRRRVVAPAARAPISSLLFDELNRLWVVRSTQPKAPGAADVYDASGKLVARVSWPAGYRLGDGDLATASALFVVTSDSSDVTHITRIRLR